MRLSNPKTRTETGFEHVVRSINVITPYGRKRLKEIQPFQPGNEEGLLEELSRLEAAFDLLRREPETVEVMSETFMEMKDNTFTVERSMNNVLTVVELFEIKTMLLQMKAVGDRLQSASTSLPDEFRLKDVNDILDVLDPGRERINTFYIYDSFSEELAHLRAEKRKLEIDIRKEQKELKKKVEAKYGISMTPKFELLVSKTDRQLMDKISAAPELTLTEEDYGSATFGLKTGQAVYELKKQVEDLNEAIEDEELQVRKSLSEKIGSHSKTLLYNCSVIGELDFNLAKAAYARQSNCVKPEITVEHVLELYEGRHLVVEEILQKKGESYCPVTIVLKDGVTCITGANMGGKTVTLKMVGLCAMLAQHGFYVPCGKARIGLSSYIHILVGDSQNVQRGLSSFGSEMEELKDILDHSKDRSLLLIDEIASGTNPVEGQALTKSIVNYLSTKNYISLVTTHFEHVADGADIRNLQVRGLADANFQNLSREIRYANRKERIQIIGKYMDYRLDEVEKDEEIPKDALNIAGMLGIDKEIIEQAKKYMEDR